MPFFNPFPDVTGALISWLSPSEEEEVSRLVEKFPAALKRAKIDWAKFQLGITAGLFTRDEYGEAADWFVNFPKLWETVRPNFNPSEAEGQGRTVTRAQMGTLAEADEFVAKLRGSVSFQNLGFVVTAVVVAGILVAGLFGVAGAVWAVGYLKKQKNISTMIDRVTAGSLPPEVLEQAVVQASSSGGFLGGITDLLKYGILAAVAVTAWPYVKKVMPGAKR